MCVCLRVCVWFTCAYIFHRLVPNHCSLYRQKNLIIQKYYSVDKPIKILKITSLNGILFLLFYVVVMINLVCVHEVAYRLHWSHKMGKENTGIKKERAILSNEKALFNLMHNFRYWPYIVVFTLTVSLLLR